DAVDNAKRELPNDPIIQPIVMDIDVDEFPIININLSGDYSIEELRTYAEYLEDRIETIDEISKVDIKGLNDKEIKIHVDLMKLEAYELTFDDIEWAVQQENLSMSAGEIKINGTRLAVSIKGEFVNINEVKKIIVKRENDKPVYLEDVAEVINGFEEPSSFARLDHQTVVSLQVIKKGGENLLSATDQIFNILDEAKETNQLPANLSVLYTNDQSDMIRKQLSNLENSMYMGVIFVVLILFFFLGIRNALFVGMAIPMSMLLSFVVIGLMGYKINMIILFSLILALGMLVDNAIVVVENIYRFVDKGYKPFEAARLGVGEIAWPIISSTATTLAAFLPLIFWGGVTGEFMKNLPITLIIVLTSSLFVALIIVPVFSSTFIRYGLEKHKKEINKKLHYTIAVIMVCISVVFYLVQWFVIANLLIFFAILGLIYVSFLHKVESWFQDIFLTKLEIIYTKIIRHALKRCKIEDYIFLRHALKRYNPLFYLGGTVFLFFATLVFFKVMSPEVNFFPENEPSYMNVAAELPIGTDIKETDKFVKEDMEKDIFRILEPYYQDSIVKSVLTTVGIGPGGEFSDQGKTPHKALTTISFVDFKDRKGIKTSNIMKELSAEMINKYPGVLISVEKDEMGPPAGEEINIEISGANYDKLILLTDSIQNFIEQGNIEGIEGLKMDLNVGKPELLVTIDRDKARRFGLNTYQIANTIRTSLFGKEISDYKIGEEEYPMQLRLKDEYRYSISSLLNQKISFRENGKMIQIPLSSVAEFKYGSTYSSVKRKDLDRVVTLYSNVIEGYNPTYVNEQIKSRMDDFEMPEGFIYQFTGQQQDQQESMGFLIGAFMIAIALIMLILVSQFNSVVKPFIIIISVLFSTIGVLGGIATFNMDFVVIMTGIGIVSLAGIVVNNAIVLIDYIELLKGRKRKDLLLDDNAYLPVKEATDCIIEAGQTRLRPVLLTAITTVLGLLSLAVGFNIDFQGLLSEFKPDIYFGGDMVIFWGPMAWAVIFGLTFATFLTLVIVPVMYRIAILIQRKIKETVIKYTAQEKNI
ncbi:MAG: efflux RND transporter permease subunit, partial [bacterium]